MKSYQLYSVLVISVIATSLVNFLIYNEGTKFQSFVAAMAEGGRKEWQLPDTESKQYLQYSSKNNKEDEETNQSIQSLQDTNNNNSSSICEELNWRSNNHTGHGPLPVILMALGRSGSSVTWDTMSALTGARNVAYEITGGTFSDSIKFFESLKENPAIGYDWIVQRLCFIKQFREDISKDKGIYGFQWKPYMRSFNHEYAIEGLRHVGKYYRDNPAIRFVYLTRNPFDRRISNIRHYNSKQRNKTISPHCSMGDDECIQMHSEFENTILMPTGVELINWLRTSIADERRIKFRLSTLNIPFIHVTYEKLYHSTNDANEWIRIFRFLGLGPTDNLTMDEVRKSFQIAPTHRRSRQETIANFDDVKQSLVGTELEHLLVGI